MAMVSAVVMVPEKETELAAARQNIKERFVWNVQMDTTTLKEMPLILYALVIDFSLVSPFI